METWTKTCGASPSCSIMSHTHFSKTRSTDFHDFHREFSLGFSQACVNSFSQRRSFRTLRRLFDAFVLESFNRSAHFPRISSPFSFFAFLGSPLFSTNQAKKQKQKTAFFLLRSQFQPSSKSLRVQTQNRTLALEWSKFRRAE